MGANEIRALERAYQDWCARRMIGLSGVDPFEFFCADQFLKQYSMSDAEIISGLVDASQDGGVDGFYFLLNRVLVNDTTAIDPRASGTINLVIMQVKETAGFSPLEIDKMYWLKRDLLDLGRQPADYHTAYHETLADKMRVFKKKYDAMSGVEQRVVLDCYYITRNDAEPGEDATTSAENVRAKAQE